MSSEENPYRPIPCAIYSEYELAILHHQRLRLIWYDEGRIAHIGIITPLDLQTRDRAEYLIARDSEQQPLIIRLDYIKQFKAVEYPS